LRAKKSIYSFQNLLEMLGKIFKYIFVLLICMAACDSKPKKSRVIHKILQNSKDSIIKHVLSDSSPYEVQILLTRIERDSMGKPSFEKYDFQLNTKQYFYPASTVKLPVAIIALKKIRKLQSQGVQITSETPFEIVHQGKLLKKNDSTHPQNKLTIAHLIKKIFLVSDNTAYNYLFDFVGRDQINEAIHEVGINDFKLFHKFSDSDNMNINPRFIFYDSKGDTVYNQNPIVSTQKLNNKHLKGILKGKGYIKDGKTIRQPMDFSEKNHASITALNQILERIIFPKLFNKKEQFKITQEDHYFLRYWMSRVPTEVDVPFYDRETYFDSYCKFFIYGDQKGLMTNKTRVFNKIGMAYGTTTDVAYIKDDQGIEFFLSATILTNKNGIFNDDQYEYDQLGVPFLAALGREMYEFEKNQQRAKWFKATLKN